MIPLAILSRSFDSSAAYIIEGVSKIVAAISLLQLSLKLPKMLGVYGSCKKKTRREGEEEAQERNDITLSLRSIRFNVAWNIWREVAECGVFLIPFFLNGENLKAIPLSAVIGFCVGLLCGVGLYYANKRLTDKRRLCIFAVLLLVILSAGLFTGGSHKLEEEIGCTKEVWRISGNFWDVDRLPMTILKPFGYNDSRTVLEICCFWLWLAFSALLHYRKYCISPKPSRTHDEEANGLSGTREASLEDIDTVELGDSSMGDVQENIANRISLGAQQGSVDINLAQPAGGSFISDATP
jgi:high-affinity iron transporter